jgi:hypothetical protein
MSVSFGENARATYMKVWATENKGKYVKAQVSTSRKDKEGQYINSSWFANFVGQCAGDAENLSRGESIKILSGQLENRKTEDGKIYTNMTIFAFEPADGSGQSSGNSRSKPVNSRRTQNLDVPPAREDDDSSEDDLPF